MNKHTHYIYIYIEQWVSFVKFCLILNEVYQLRFIYPHLFAFNHSTKTFHLVI